MARASAVTSRDWETFNNERVRAHRDQCLSEDVRSRRTIQRIRLSGVLNKAQLLFPRNAPSARQVWMYVLCCTLGWTPARTARVMGVHRTLVSKYLPVVEAARDDYGFDETLSDVEAKVVAVLKENAPHDNA